MQGTFIYYCHQVTMYKIVRFVIRNNSTVKTGRFYNKHVVIAVSASKESVLLMTHVGDAGEGVKLKTCAISVYCQKNGSH